MSINPNRAKSSAIIIKGSPTPDVLARMQNISFSMPTDEVIPASSAIEALRGLETLVTAVPFWMGDIVNRVPLEQRDDVEAIFEDSFDPSSASHRRHIAARYPPSVREHYCRPKEAGHYHLTYSHFKAIHVAWIREHEGLDYALLDLALAHELGSNRLRAAIRILKQMWLNMNREEQVPLSDKDIMNLLTWGIEEVVLSIAAQFFGNNPIKRDPREMVVVRGVIEHYGAYKEIANMSLGEVMRDRATELGLQPEDTLKVEVVIIKVENADEDEEDVDDDE